MRTKLWPANTTTGTPLFMAKRSTYYLQGFKWYEHLRPKYPLDVFNIPEGMDELLNSQDETPGKPRRKTKTDTKSQSESSGGESLDAEIREPAVLQETDEKNIIIEQ